MVNAESYIIMDLATAWNAEFMEVQYKRWKADPASVSNDWRFFFEGFELAASGATEAVEGFDEQQLLSQSRVESLIYRYRDLGHLLACLDPLAATTSSRPSPSTSAMSSPSTEASSATRVLGQGVELGSVGIWK